MKVTKQVAVPASTETQLDYVKCELCPSTSKSEDWSPRQYKVTEPEVTLRVGTNYPEGGSITTIVLDICPTCFKTKLIPWFTAQGGTLRQEDHDW